MQMPALNDTIVAVSSGWQPSPVGIVRLSGVDAFGLLRRLGPTPPARDRPCCTAAPVQFDSDGTLPADVFWFPAPRSYTGQDVVEVHTVGCLPLLRELSARLIELGARRALPGEFTARAFLNHRLSATQVEGVLNLMQSEHEAGLRQAARLARGSFSQAVQNAATRITDLLAQVEAGIDFVEEEDVRFITPAEAIQTLDDLLTDLDAAAAAIASEPRGGKPHVALVGRPNAGKSTLFNALVGYERALVSPVLGTTRDVLSADVELDGQALVLQDCAGLGRTADELELATHLATERAAQLADLVLWIHAADTAWSQPERKACTQIPRKRRFLVISKADLVNHEAETEPPISFSEQASVSATTGAGMRQLRTALVRWLEHAGQPAGGTRWGGELRAAASALRRARGLATRCATDLACPELISLELRVARDQLLERPSTPLDEEILDRVFAQFCVGK